MEDQELQLIIAAKQSNERIAPAAESLELRRLLQIWDQLTISNGVLYRLFLDTAQPSGFRYKLVVLRCMRDNVLKEVHEGAMGEHLGEEKTLQKLKERFYWPGHWQSVQEWCRTCSPCCRCKTPAPNNRAPLQCVAVGSPMQLVAVDILGPLLASSSGNKYVLVARGLLYQVDGGICNPQSGSSNCGKKVTG